MRGSARRGVRLENVEFERALGFLGDGPKRQPEFWVHGENVKSAGWTRGEQRAQDRLGHAKHA